MQQDSIDCAAQAMEKFNIEKVRDKRKRRRGRPIALISLVCSALEALSPRFTSVVARSNDFVAVTES